MRKKSVRAIVSVLILAVAGAVVWKCHKSWLAGYYAERLASTPNGEAEAAIDRLAGFGDAAVPHLLRLLHQDVPACQHAGKTLAKIIDDYPADDDRVIALAGKIREDYSQFSPQGRHAALALIEALMARNNQCDQHCREIVHAGLQDEVAANREQAIVLAMRNEIHGEAEVIAMLRDPDPTVRRHAMLAVGLARELISDDDLLRWLHDGDAGVCELCAAALRGRGLREKDVTMGRLITDPSFLKRLEVLNYLDGDDELDPQAWLGRLSQDSVPAVRAAALRVAMEFEGAHELDFVPRARLMAANDPDGTVRQMANEMLQRKSR